MQNTHAVIVVTQKLTRKGTGKGTPASVYTAHCPALGLTAESSSTPEDAVRRLTESVPADAAATLQQQVPDELVAVLPVKLLAVDEAGGPAVEWGTIGEDHFTDARSIGSNEPTIGAVQRLLNEKERAAFLAEIQRATLGDQLTRVLTRWWVHALLGRYDIQVPESMDMRLIELPRT
ncbi:hypothetical protein OG711_38925 (plasmid) [Streptomyces uncialis]|uniref:hypothetical protein n=1 Tax=Streptomyces uncialis TaxID=1048205 RepID=UPI002E31FAB1|nr:hypothetical protein [Streptomyces uncialis]WTE16069.1 hypothetical protein OG924_37410 [Streptomyces uncialis]